MLEISFRNGKDTFDGCSSNPLPLFVEKRVIFKMFNTLYVPPPLNNTSCICHDSRHVYNKPSIWGTSVSISNVYLYIKSINLQIYIFIIQIWTFIIISVPSYGFLRWSVCQQRPASVPLICLLFVPCSKMTASSIVNKYTKDVIGG